MRFSVYRVDGGLRAIPAVGKLEVNGDLAVGAIVRHRAPALAEPAHQIANNAGRVGSVVVRDILANQGNYAYNAATDRFQDLVKAGVIDPAKVAKKALQNAASIAGLLITTAAMVTEVKEKKKRTGGTPADMDGMY